MNEKILLLFLLLFGVFGYLRARSCRRRAAAVVVVVVDDDGGHELEQT